MPNFSCPHCHRPGRVPGNLAGRQVNCPHCQQPFIAPAVRLADPPPAVQPQIPVNVVNVHRQDDEDDDNSPSGIAAFFWAIVLIVSTLVCFGFGVAAWLIWKVPPTDSAFGANQLLATFVVAGASTVPLYIMARAVDRLTQ